MSTRASAHSAHPAALVPTRPRLLVVILNYRTPDLVIDCLRSLSPERTSAFDMRVVVTDNASLDDSVARIRDAIAQEGWTHWVTVKPLDSNGGFSYGNNAAIRPALAADDPPDLIWLLNPDTIIQRGASK